MALATTASYLFEIQVDHYKEFNYDAPRDSLPVRVLLGSVLAVAETLSNVGLQPVVALEYVARAVGNLAGVIFRNFSKMEWTKECSIKNSLIYLERAIKNVIGTPVAILMAPFQLVHQLFWNVVDPAHASAFYYVPPSLPPGTARAVR